MGHRIRLGPIAIFLAVVAVILSTLAVLTVATSNADMAMAKRFARVTQIRYELEAEGEKYLREVDEKAASGTVTAESVEAEKTLSGTFVRTISRNGYKLKIEITDPGNTGEYEVVGWKMTKEWNAEDPYTGIWQGGGDVTD